MVGMVPKSSYVDDESKNKRGVLTLRYPVERGAAAVWDDARKGVVCLVVPDSRTTAPANRTTAIVNQSGLPEC